MIIAGQDFGPNNELVKFGRDVAETFNRVVKETEKTLKSAEEAAKKGADAVIKPLNKLCRKFYKKC